MEQMLPFPFIEAPASAKLNVLPPCTPRAANGESCEGGGPVCGGPCEVKEQLADGRPHHEANSGEALRKRARPVPAEASGPCTHKAKTAARLGGPFNDDFPCQPFAPIHVDNSSTASANLQQQSPATAAADTAGDKGAAPWGGARDLGVHTEGEDGKRESSTLPFRRYLAAEPTPLEGPCWAEFQSTPFNSLKRAVFRCLQDLRAEGGAPAEGGPRGPGLFSTHILNVLDAIATEDLAPYLEIFSVCLWQGVSPRCLPANARQLMLEALAALKATGYSVYVRQVFGEYSRVLRTLRRRDLLLGPLRSSGSNSSITRGRSRGALLYFAAAAEPEDAQLADMWVNASLEDPAMKAAQREGGPQAKACRSGISQEYLLLFKGAVVRQLRGLRRLAPIWAARERAYQYHLDAVLTAQTPGELVKYVIVFSSLHDDPDGKHPVSVASLLECIRELHALQRTDPQENTGATLPVTQAELAQSLAALQSKRNSDAGAAVGAGSAGRKHCARSVTGLPALATRGQKHRLTSPQLEAEVAANLQRLSLRLPSPFTSPFFREETKPREAEASVMYAEELMAVAAENVAQPTATQQAAYAELQRLMQYWAEGVFPAVSEEETPPPPPPLSPPHSVSSTPGRQLMTWKLSRSRSTPCPVFVVDRAHGIP